MNQGRDLDSTAETITDVAVRECNCRPVPAGTVLLSFKLSVGKVGITKRSMFTNEAIAALPITDASKILPDFLYWSLRSIDLTRGVDRAAKGLTLNTDKLRRVCISLPPLPEQRRIAEILDKADALRAKRHAALAQLDVLIQSIFLDFIATMGTHSPIVSIADAVEAIIDYRGKSPTKTSAGVPLITARVVKDGELLQPTEFIAEADYDAWMRRGLPMEGDVVFTTEAPLGEVAQLDGHRVALAQRLLVLRGKLDLTRFDGHLTRPKLRAEVFNDSTTEAVDSRNE
jgi:type I restriction enzyme S subunit